MLTDTAVTSAGLQDVVVAREFLDQLGLDSCKIIAKLDAKSSLVNFRGILNAADGIMLSRGNLGLDCLPEKIAVIQKNVTTSCNLLGKPCIVTRIVDTMVSAPRPTRAEATDVANAVLDGADCMMLGAETLRGRDPANAVRTVVACCYAAEAEFQHAGHFEYLMREATKAQEQGIAVPGGADHEGTPDSSPHGSNTALSQLGGDGSAHGAQNLVHSQSHVNLASSLSAMTRNAQIGSTQSSLSALSFPYSSTSIA
jgi:pyruvate kinase